MIGLDALELVKEEIRKKEPELLIKHTAELQRCDTIYRRKLSPADKIARAIMHITSLYGQSIKNARGGWTCGTYVNHVRTALAHQITSSYDDSQLHSFINFCVDCADGQKSLQDADKDIKDMVEKFLDIRPAPLVHLPTSWWQQVLEGEG